MAIRQARLIALLLVVTIALLALASVVWFGADTPFPNGSGLNTRQAAASSVGYALLLSLVFDRAARMRRWRRNIVRAGSALAAGWIGTLSLILLMQWIAWAEALGHPIARQSALAIAIALVVLAKANFLPKSRPGWLNGTTLPPFASDPLVWRKVHRASAIRLTSIAAGILLCVGCVPGRPDLLPVINWLLAVELALATVHGLWLGGLPWSRGASV